MLIRIGYELIFDVPQTCPIMTQLDIVPARDADVRRPGGMRVEPEIPVEVFRDGFGNRCSRLVAPPGKLRLWDDLVVEDGGLPDPASPDAAQARVEDLPTDVLVFLLASRYCEVDRLSDIAWDLFGSTPTGWGRVQAICDWVHAHVEFGYKYARSTKTAYDVYEEKQGVCRDFTHLALTLCRCMNIPARYATGYLGDIGVPLSRDPMDFSGWFEVFLGGKWHTFDARHNKARIGRILMGHGRDAVDVALTTSFGPTRLEKFLVWTNEVDESALSQPQSDIPPPLPVLS